MKTLEQLASIPESGIVIRQEGAVLRLFFGIEPAEPMPSPEGEETAQPEGLCECYNVDVRAPFTYGSIVAAIVNDKYSADDVQALSANCIEAKNPDSPLSDGKRAEYEAEWAEFQQWRAKAKGIASAVIESMQS